MILIPLNLYFILICPQSPEEFKEPFLLNSKDNT